MFQSFYLKQFIEIFGAPPKAFDAPGDEAVQTRLTHRGLHVPEALFDYYSLFGHHAINNGQNRLRTIEELEWHDGWLIFMEEDQGMVCWGIHHHDLTTPDPPIWQGMVGEEMEWLQADTPLSRFLIDKWREIV